MKKLILFLFLFCLLLLPIRIFAQGVTPGTINVRQSGTWTVSSTQSGTWTVQPGNTANTTAWLVTGTGGTFPASQSGTWTVQPGNTANTTAWLITNAGNGTVFNNQQAVTASAVALATNTAKNVCVKALVANSLNIYIGASGVTTSTGLELAPGDSTCLPVSNSNLLFVIASNTGSSVSYIGTN